MVYFFKEEISKRKNLLVSIYNTGGFTPFQYILAVTDLGRQMQNICEQYATPQEVIDRIKELGIETNFVLTPQILAIKGNMRKWGVIGHISGPAWFKKMEKNRGLKRYTQILKERK